MLNGRRPTHCPIDNLYSIYWSIYTNKHKHTVPVAVLLAAAVTTHVAAITAHTAVVTAYGTAVTVHTAAVALLLSLHAHVAVVLPPSCVHTHALPARVSVSPRRSCPRAIRNAPTFVGYAVTFVGHALAQASPSSHARIEASPSSLTRAPVSPSSHARTPASLSSCGHAKTPSFGAYSHPLDTHSHRGARSRSSDTRSERSARAHIVSGTRSGRSARARIARRALRSLGTRPDRSARAQIAQHALASLRHASRLLGTRSHRSARAQIIRHAFTSLRTPWRWEVLPHPAEQSRRALALTVSKHHSFNSHQHFAVVLSCSLRDHTHKIHLGRSSSHGSGHTDNCCVTSSRPSPHIHPVYVLTNPPDS